MNSRHPLDRVLQRLGLQAAEQGLFAWAGLCLLTLGAASIALLNAAETLFLKRVGVEHMPLLLLASAGMLVVTTTLVGRVISHDPARWLPRILAALAFLPLPFVLLAQSREPLVIAGMALISRQIMAMGLLVFWVAMGSLVPARRAKHIFAPLTAGVTLGVILGSFGSEPLARTLGFSGLIAVCVGGLAASALCGTQLRRRGTRLLDRALGSRAGSRSEGGDGIFALIRTSRLFRLMGIALFCAGVLNPILYFEFASVLDTATQGPEGEQLLMNLYSQFRGWLNVAMLVFQLWLGAVLFRRIGLPLSMSLLPLVFVIGFTWVGLDFALVVAFASFGAANLAEDGLSDSAARVIYNLFPDRVRNRASGLLEGPVLRSGGMLGNGFVLATLALGGSAVMVGWAALPLALFWLGSALVFWRAYPGLLLQASAEHGLGSAGIDRSTLLDASTLRSLAPSLIDPDPRACRAAVDLLVDGERSLVIALLAEAIEEAPDSNRPLLVDALYRLVEPMAPGSVRSEPATRSLARTLLRKTDWPTEQRADLLRAYARLTGGTEAGGVLADESMTLLDRALGDRTAPVRLGAVAELHRRDAPPPGLPDLDRTLDGALRASDALVRRAARKELRAMLISARPDARWRQRLDLLAGHLEQRADRVDTVQALLEVARHQGAAIQAVARDVLRYAEDRDPRVRGPLLALTGHAGLVEEASRLVTALGAREPEVVAGAQEGLVQLGTAATLPLLVGLEFGGPRRREAVLSVLRELEVDAATLEMLRAQQLEAIQESVLRRSVLDDFPGLAAGLLRRRLEERIEEGLGTLIDLLSALYDDPRLSILEHRLRRSKPGRDRDLLIEGIEALLGRQDTADIVPLLEPGEWGKRGRAAARSLGREMPEPQAVLADLRDSPDASLERLAAVVSVESGEAIGDALPMPPSIDFAVRLQEIPPFDRLGTQQLMALAALLQEQKVAAGERIYAVGEEGERLYFVLEGEIELRRGSTLVDRVGPDSFIGELSCLEGVPHSREAVACSDARLLGLDREDLLPLLEEAPGLAIGMAQRLSTRVRHLENRLEQAGSVDENAS